MVGVRGRGWWGGGPLGAFLCIRTPNTGQLNSLFHIFAEFRPISGLPSYNPIYYWIAASAQFSPNEGGRGGGARGGGFLGAMR